MMSSKKTAILSLLTVFLLGAAVGIVVDRFLINKPPKPPRSGVRGDFLFEMFTKELELTATQQDTLRTILAQIREQFKAAGQLHFERTEEIRKQFGSDFEKILNDQQRAKYQEMVAKFERDHRPFETHGRQRGPDKTLGGRDRKYEGHREATPPPPSE